MIKAPPKKIVIKIGGSGATDRSVVKTLSKTISGLQTDGYQVLVVHGGGHALTELAQTFGHVSKFVNGRRVTDDQLLALAKLSFVGRVGTDMMAWMIGEGIAAVALSGISGGAVQVSKRPVKDNVDFGWVGDITSVEPRLFQGLMDDGFVPLVASLAVDPQGLVYNVNADTVACALAAGLGAQELIFLTELPGLLMDVNKKDSTLAQLSIAQIKVLIADGRITAGMLPKLGAIESAFARSQSRSQPVPLRVQLISWNSLGDHIDWLNSSLGTTISL